MPTTTPVQALPIPILADIANVPLHVQNLAQALETKLVMIFASTAARTAAIPSPTEGMTSYQLDTHRLEYYDGTGWRPLPKFTQCGSLTLTTSTGANSVTGSVVFTTAFASLPIVTTSQFTGALTGLLAHKITALSTSGFTVSLYTTNGTNFATAGNVFVHWSAQLP